MRHPDTLPPGFMVLQGNRLEDLRRLVMAWIAAHPLDALEPEVFLAQSNGIAQWLKMSMAGSPDADGSWGIAFGVDTMLPARFQWLAYRAVLEAAEGGGAVPETSPFDKPRLRWRLMQLLQQPDEAVFAPLRHFLADDPDLRKRYQLAERLADLYDQYQVYRADWLAAWSEGRDLMVDPQGREILLAEDQRWQARLWRDIEASLPEHQRPGPRAGIHQRFVAAARQLTPETLPAALPRRLVVFGISALPRQVLEALAALSGAMQIMLCAVNPCRHYWGDIVEERHLLRASYRRQQRREAMPEVLAEDELHLHAHPLLAAWGKQGRDYLHLLDEHDDTGHYQALFAGNNLHIDLFDNRPDTRTLLGQLQDDILELRPLRESRPLWPAVDPDRDGSLIFHVAHGPQRELEILHDQLLDAFARDPGLTPRDIIVMVPDIAVFAPHIHAVFGQFDRDDPRRIPYQVADQPRRHREPLLVALEQLLQLPQLRFRASELMELLDIAAVRERFGIGAADLPLLQRWVAGANIRWGIDSDHRRQLDLPEHGDLHTWRFGLRRMLLGYAAGDHRDGPDWAGIAPYDEVSGLDAALAGPLFRFVDTLDHHRRALDEPATPTAWVARLQALLADCLTASTPEEERLLGELGDGLQDWLDECADSAFNDPLPLAVVRENWLARVDEPRLNQRFLGGTVTFATLLPMRAIPFRKVCLLGMNDGAYPRQTQRNDFDLMALRGQYRPGDRSRREDDRYLFLEALLSARESLYISWSGRHVRDNSEKPPSVLVAQLRDHLAQGWSLAPNDMSDTRDTEGKANSDSGTALLAALTTEHPLQPFGEAYFREPDEAAADPIPAASRARLFTYADEWQGLHGQLTARLPQASLRDHDALHEPLPPWQPEQALTLNLLADFLRDPAGQFYRQRLRLFPPGEQAVHEDDEPFDLSRGLERWQSADLLLQPLGRQLARGADLDPAIALAAAAERQQREGLLPPPPFGPLAANDLIQSLQSTLEGYREQLRHYPDAVDPLPEVALSTEVDLDGTAVTLALVDTLDQLRRADDGGWCRLVLLTSRIHKGSSYNWPQLLRHWPAHLALQLQRPQSPSLLVSDSDTLRLPGLDADTAAQHLEALLHAWLHAMQSPLPLTGELACAALNDEGTLDPPGKEFGKVLDQQLERSWALARQAEDAEDVLGHPDVPAAIARLYGPLVDHIKSLRQLEEGAPN